MRRGHARGGGWRNENPRHFRPRNGGNSYFRPSRQGFNSLETSRYTGPYLRHLGRPNPYNSSFDNERSHVNRSEESRYRTNRQNTYQTNSARPHRHNDERQILPAFHKNRPVPVRPPDIYNEQNKFYENSFENNYMCKSNMGDVDHRQIVQNRDNFNTSTISPWTNEARAYVHRNLNSNQRSDVPELNKIHIPEYSGHRPPSSDHYGCNPTISTIDKSNSFSRSVDDTVDIVRKRLLNRCEPNNPDNLESRQIIENQNILKDQVNTELGGQDQPIKRRVQRQKQKDQSNCAKIKNKIVKQLFKMDKERIHKLMDNPNSSTKFEYAINSLITESQNSFNRHLRSVAEKSLCSSSDDFIQSDSNTIYEDTFMKQMQCILDPQDTILLEDIKPMVMAELNNILQLDNFDSVCEDEALYRQDEEIDYKPYHDDNAGIQNSSFGAIHEHSSHSNIKTDYVSIENIDNQENRNNNVQVQQSNYTEYWPLFERRTKRISKNSKTDITTPESQFHSTLENMEHLPDSTHQTQQQFFDTNSDHFSEVDDTFAELDNQYHVAVDHDFIEQEDDLSSQHATNDNIYASIIGMETSTKEDKDNTQQIKKEVINNHHVDATFSNDMSENQVDSSYIQSSKTLHISPHLDRKRYEEPNKTYEEKKRYNNVPHGTKSTSNSRKRSSDLRPSHRKEKRKKSDGTATSESKQISNKNIIFNVNDCANKLSEKCDASSSSTKSIFNLFISKEQGQAHSKDSKNVGTRDKYCSDKRISKKEIPKTPDDKSKKARTKNNSTSSNHSISPKHSNSSSTNSQTCKLDTKTTLKTIDMFTEQPKKANVHQARRNTALTPKIDATKDNIENKFIEKVSLSKQFSKSHVAVQVSKKMHSKESQTFELKESTTKFCQTELKTLAVKATQTDDKILDKPCTKVTDAFERMKEIDLEIQVLLQEKFKLYSSIESKESCTDSLQTLGMTVLDVSPLEYEDNDSNINILAENVIVDEFVNIPVEEFEQIVLENVTQEQDENEKTSKKHRSRKISSKGIQNLDVSATVSKKTNKKTKTPNISLIEQIITDERPLEDIISLDAFEIPSTKRGPKNRKMSKKKTVTNTKTLKINSKNYNIKECSVVLTREDFKKYIKDDLPFNHYQNESVIEGSQELNQYTTIQNHVVEDTVVTDIQFDMLDVSEDIVIGDLCEVKSDYDKEVVETLSLPVSEEVILDNSQSLIEDVSAPLIEKGEECKVYDYSADENLQRDSILVSGNADAVLAIECVQNNFLAASLDGNVYYFNGDGKLISTLRGSNLAVTCLTIVQEKYGITVYTGSLDSRIRYYDLETGLEKGPECNVLSPIQTMDRAWDTVFVGTRTGFVLQFECKNNMLIPVSTVKFSEQSILALKTMKEGPRKVLLVAARSENVTIKDAQTGLLLRSLAGPKMTVYSLLYADGKVYCGTSSHQIHVFDYTSGSHAGTHSGGKGAVCLRATGGFVFAGCYDGCVYVYREGESEPLAQLRGPSIMLLSLAVVDTKIIAGYKDRSLYIWKIPHCILQDMIL